MSKKSILTKKIRQTKREIKNTVKTVVIQLNAINYSRKYRLVNKNLQRYCQMNIDLPGSDIPSRSFIPILLRGGRGGAVRHNH